MVQGGFMRQQRLWVDTLRSAVDELVEAAGGPKKVAAALRPNLDPDDAAKWLKHALDASRREKLSADDLLELMKLGRKRGCHVLAAFVADETGYDVPRPRELQQELQQVAHDIESLHSQAQQRVARLAQLQALLAEERAA